MASKDKESKTLQDKLKQFFKLNNKQSLLKGRQKFALTPEMENLISQNTPISQRTKAIKELSDAVLSNQFEHITEEHSSEAAGTSYTGLRDDKRKGMDRNSREKSTLDCVRSWNDMEKVRRCLADLFHRDVPKDIREVVFQFYLSLVQGQYDKLGSMRVYIFEIIKTHDVAEDISLRLQLLNALTENGRDIGHMEDEMGAFVLQWMPEIVKANLTVEYLDLLNTLIKFNAAYIDEVEIMKLIQYTCFLCCHHSSDVVVKRCLQLLNTVLCYSTLPTASLDDFVSALCRTVTDKFCDDSWEIMRKLLGTHLGHAALYTLCRILQDSQHQDDIKLLRGAVFYISMGLFGNKSIPTLKCNYTAVLPSLLQAARSGHTVVVYEVVISCQRLVTKYGRDLHDPSWDLILQILEESLKFCATLLTSDVHSTITIHIHETISTIEKLIEAEEYNGSVRPVYELAEKCAHVRPETSVLRLVQYLASSARPTNANWISKLHSLLDKFFKQETRTVIRTKVLDVLSNIIHTHRAVYEDELIEQIVIPYLGHPEQDPDVAVRSASAQLLIELCVDCETKKCLELLDILEKLLNLTFEQPLSSGGHITEADVPDVRLVASGMVRIFVTKMYRLPSCHATRAYCILVSHLENHFRQPSVLEHAPAIRYVILECFLNLRANSFYHLGYVKSRGNSFDGQLDFSPYLAVDHKHCERTGGASSPTPVSPAPTPYPPCVVTPILLTRACRVIINCLSAERDWLVLQLVLKEIPHVLKNKALFSSRHGNDIDQMALALCTLMNDKSVMDTLRNTPAKFPRSEFQGFIFPVLTALASYHTHLDSTLQQRLIVCLEYGLQSRFAAHVVAALTTCILEMKDAMYKRLPEVLLSLSKISATVHIAIPILSFLSTLTRLPKVFASFVGDQYMSVFAICLPYTNPFRYNHFTVSLAHHVIAAWFLKCRLPFRRDFVKFITTGLRANVILPIEEGHSLKGEGRPEVVNEDSSSRKRSSSLTEQGSRRRPIGGSSRLDAKPVDLKPPIDDALHTFHLELMETCIDLMARYTFSTCSAMPKRLPQMQTLLEKGQSNTWLLGTKLITVTTSACNQKVLRMGLCDKCWTSCRLEQNPATPQEGSVHDGANVFQEQTPNDGVPSKLTLQRSSSADVAPMSMRDDLAQGSASASSSAGGSARSLSLLVQSSSNSGDTDGHTGRSSGAINSPSDETRKFPLPLDAMEPETSKLDQLLYGFDRLEGAEKQQCSCWCNGWAEIHVRRPTGDMSWAMRLQNRTSSNDLSLSDLATLYLPSAEIREPNETPPHTQAQHAEQLEVTSVPPAIPAAVIEPVQSVPASQNAQSEPMAIHPSPVRCSPSRQSSRDSLEEEEEGQAGDSDIDDGNGRARNPVRRSNSSPEMSGGWRNPFLAAAAQDREKMDKMKPSYSKDLRANCEAIPEEIAGLGTTPPSSSPTVAKFPPSQPPPPAHKRTDAGPPTSRVPSGPTITTVSSPARNPALHSSSTSPVPSNPANASLLHSSKPSSPLTKSSTPLLLPSSLSSKPPLSPTQARHQTTDSVEPDPKAKLRSAAPTDLKLGLSSVPSSRLSEVRMGASRLSSASGSAASSAAGSDPTLGSSSSLDSRAGNEALQMQSSAPASPTTSHAHHLSASAELINRDEGDLRPDPTNLPKLQFSYRDRGHTISVMSPVRKPPRSDWDAKRNKALTTSPRVKETQRPNVNPILVFLQLYHSAYFGNTAEKPLLVPNTASYARSIKNFDRIQPYENHKVGVLYVGRGQANSEVDILRNTVGSLRYTEFLQRLGTLINLQDTDPQATFLGGLDRTGRDGKYAYFWQDDITQVIFFVTTLMPNHDNDLSFTEKKKHIGNAYVTIVYNESGEEYNIQTIKGQYNYVIVEIKPLDHGKNEVYVRTRDELKDSGVACEPKVASDANLAVLARQLALHASLASVVSSSLKLSGNSTACNPYASNWLERLRSLKQIRERLLKEISNEDRDLRRDRRDDSEKNCNNAPNSSQSVSSEVSGKRRHQMDDFTEYT